MIAPLALVACGSAPTRIYPLTPVQPAARIDSAVPIVRVDSVHVPPEWDRIEILSPTLAGALKINDFDRWSAPLAQATRQVLSADLESRMPPGSVIFPHLTKSPRALGISLDILLFTIDSSQGSLQASWTITSAQTTDAAKRDVATVTTAVSGTEPATIAHAWSLLIGQIADRIAADAAAFPVL